MAWQGDKGAVALLEEHERRIRGWKEGERNITAFKAINAAEGLAMAGRCPNDTARQMADLCDRGGLPLPEIEKIYRERLDNAKPIPSRTPVRRRPPKPAGDGWRSRMQRKKPSSERAPTMNTTKKHQQNTARHRKALEQMDRAQWMPYVSDTDGSGIARAEAVLQLLAAAGEELTDDRQGRLVDALRSTGAPPSPDEIGAFLATMGYTGDDYTSEKDLQDRIIAAAEESGWAVMETTSTVKGKGFPDLVLVKDGQMIVAELKRAGGYVSAAQWEWLDRLAAVPGCSARAVCGTAETDAFIALLKEPF